MASGTVNRSVAMALAGHNLGAAIDDHLIDIAAEPPGHRADSRAPATLGSSSSDPNVRSALCHRVIPGVLSSYPFASEENWSGCLSRRRI